MRFRQASVVLCLAALLFALHPASGQNLYSRKEAPKIRSATPNHAVVERYGLFELTLDLGATYDNPFDPDDINVHAVFTSGAGKAYEVNGFLYRSFTRRLENGAETITPAGEPVWKIRFTPPTAGEWNYEISARDRTGSTQLADGKFKVEESTKPGFLRRSPSNPLTFAWGNGRPFFGIGENVCWGGKRGSFDYDDWLPALAKAGGNFIRIWMCSWNCALEWSPASKGEWRSGDYLGVGSYSLDNAWKLDTILDLAERQGISVMLCLGTYGEFKDGGYFNEGQWKANPYNATNGGPCAKAADFWTNAPARKLYQRRLRYLGARYGDRTNLHSWEFWNEAMAPAPWVAEMARYLKGTGEFAGKGADPYRHLVTTTYGNPDVWKIPEIDFTQTHSYGTGNIPDHAPVLHKEARDHAAVGKPHWTAEFGIDWRNPDDKYDPDGQAINLHNGLWSSALSGDAGAALIWWWDNYVHPKNLYAQFRPIRRFTETVPWNNGTWKPLKSRPAKPPADPAEAPPLRIYGLRSERFAVAWIQNIQNNWKNALDKHEIRSVPATPVVLMDIPPGHHRLEWWDTWKGEVSKREEADAQGGELQLTVPSIQTDAALRLSAER